MINVIYSFETDDRGKRDEVTCRVYTEVRINTSPEEQTAADHFVELVKTILSNEEGITIEEGRQK